ncbi:MAG: hypothetical protein ACP6IS_05005 [Candidatus Asgardarchaeia archaeon]
MANEKINTRMVTVIIIVLLFLVSILTFNIFSNGIISNALASDYLRVRRGTELVISATLGSTSNENVSLAGQKIFFYDETNNILIGYNITDSTGLALYRWRIPTNYSLGLITINATYKGNSTSLFVSSYAKTLIDIYSPIFLTYNITDSTNDPFDHVVAPGGNVLISIRAYDDSMTPISNLSIILYDDSHIFKKSTQTNEKGVAVFSISVPYVDDTNLTLTLESNASSLFYDNARETTMLIIRHIRSRIENFIVYNLNRDMNEYCTPNDKIMIKGVLKTEFGTPIDGAFIYLRSNSGDVFLVNKTNHVGEFIFTFNISDLYPEKLGEIHANVFYPGNDAILESVHSFSFSIKKTVFYHIIIPKNNTDVNVGDTITVKLSFSGVASDIPLNCQLIILNENNILNTIFLNNSSEVNLTISIPPPNGVFLLTFYLKMLSLKVTNFYAIITNKTQLILFRYAKPNLSLFLKNSQSFYAIGDEIILKISLWMTKPIAYNKIYILENKTGQLIFEGKTNYDGVLVVRLKFDETYLAFFNDSSLEMLLQFSVISLKNSTYLISKKIQMFSITLIKKYRTFICLNTVKNNGSLIIVNLTLAFNLNKTGIPNKNVDILINTSKIQITTNDIGCYIIYIKNDRPIKMVIISAYFNGNSLLTSSNATTILYGNSTFYRDLTNDTYEKSSNLYFTTSTNLYLISGVILLVFIVIKFRKLRNMKIRKLMLPFSKIKITK